MINGDPMGQRWTISFLTLACVLAARAVAAQGSTEVFAGYSYLRDPNHSVLTITAGDDSFRLGWAAGIALPVWRGLVLVGDVSGHYARRTTFVDDVRRSFHAFAAGPRVAARLGAFVPFVEALAGAGVARAEAFGVTAITSGPLLQGGGGVDYRLNRRVGARLQLDYRRITGSSDGRQPTNQFRALAAVVFR